MVAGGEAFDRRKKWVKTGDSRRRGAIVQNLVRPGITILSFSGHWRNCVLNVDDPCSLYIEL